MTITITSLSRLVRQAMDSTKRKQKPEEPKPFATTITQSQTLAYSTERDLEPDWHCANPHERTDYT